MIRIESKFTNDLEIKYPSLEDEADIRVINNNIRILNEKKLEKENIEESLQGIAKEETIQQIIKIISSGVKLDLTTPKTFFDTTNFRLNSKKNIPIGEQKVFSLTGTKGYLSNAFLVCDAENLNGKYISLKIIIDDTVKFWVKCNVKTSSLRGSKIIIGLLNLQTIFPYESYIGDYTATHYYSFGQVDLGAVEAFTQERNTTTRVIRLEDNMLIKEYNHNSGSYGTALYSVASNLGIPFKNKIEILANSDVNFANVHWAIATI